MTTPPLIGFHAGLPKGHVQSSFLEFFAEAAFTQKKAHQLRKLTSLLISNPSEIVYSLILSAITSPEGD
jgi:hypothetical protein